MQWVPVFIVPIGSVCTGHHTPEVTLPALCSSYFTLRAFTYWGTDDLSLNYLLLFSPVLITQASGIAM